MNDYNVQFTMPPNAFVVNTPNNEEIIRITKEGDLYHKGRLVETDQEYVKAVTEFLNHWNRQYK
jgi:hypothetical protein